MLRAKRHVYKGCPCKRAAAAAGVRGASNYIQKPAYLEYEDNVWRAYQKQVVEELERSLGKPKMDLEGGGTSGEKYEKEAWK